MARVCRLALSLSVIGFLIPAPAAAQGFIAPFIGTTFNTASVGSATSGSKPGYGIAFGRLGNGFGGETEISYFPEVFDNESAGLAKSKVFSFMGNTIIGGSIGRVHPYGAFGVGTVRLNVTSIGDAVLPSVDFSKYYFGFNAGGGLFGFFTDNLGLRGDIRYTRAFGFNLEDIQEATGIELTKFDFWRASVAFVAKF